MARYYILDKNKNAIPVDDIRQWGTAFEDFDARCVGKFQAKLHTVSTVFLGVNHSFDENSPPLLFETMVFDEDGRDCGLARTSTWKDAEYMHRRVCQEVTKRENGGGANTLLSEVVVKFLGDM